MKKYLLVTTLFLSLVTVSGCSNSSESDISQDSATLSEVKKTKESIEETDRTHEKEAKKEKTKQREAEEAEARQREAEEAEARQHEATITQRDTESGITGLCNDGTTASGNPSARGKANSCYGHGGWER